MSLKGNATGNSLQGSVNKLTELHGYSAYEVAVINGFSGTEEEWLASLKGDKGDKGDTGDKGDKGDKGEMGDVGMLKVVSPEMYGAVGDGVTDDTAAMQACVNANKPICATGRYKITRDIRCDNGLYLFGGGTFYGQSANSRWQMFFVTPSNQTGRNVVVRDISFISTRDVSSPDSSAIPSIPRDEGFLTSNVRFLNISGGNTDGSTNKTVENVTVENVRFENSDSDLIMYGCKNVNVNNFISNNSTASVYAQDCDKLFFRDGEIEPYNLVNAGDHHFYFCSGNGDVVIENVKMFSKVINSSHCPIHFWVETSLIQSGVGITRSAFIRDCYIECTSGAASVVEKGITFENTEFVEIAEVDGGVFAAENSLYSGEGIHIFRNCIFKAPNDIQVNNYRKAIFENCTFDKQVVIRSQNTTTVKGCDINGMITFYGATVIPKFEYCNIKSDSSCVYISSSIDLTFVGCCFEANGDGISSLRSAGIITMIGCRGTNLKANKMFNYDGGVTTGTYKLYNCVFPDITFRTNANGATLVEHNTLWKS